MLPKTEKQAIADGTEKVLLKLREARLAGSDMVPLLWGGQSPKFFDRWWILQMEQRLGKKPTVLDRPTFRGAETL